MQREWEIARWQIMHIIAPYSKKKSILTSDITVFSWEKNKKVEIPNREEVLDTIEKWNRWEEKHKDNG